MFQIIEGKKMNIQTTEALAHFCAEQCLAFDPQAWEAPHHDNTLKAVARYLAHTSWYGHEEALERIAGPAIDSGLVRLNQEGAPALVDLVNLSVRVRCRIAMLQGKHPTPREPKTGGSAGSARNVRATAERQRQDSKINR